MPVSRRAAVIGAVVLALAVVAVLAVVLTRGRAEPPPLRAPAYTADTVPEMSMSAAKRLPKGCGVSAATIKKYAPGDSEPHSTKSCRWYSLNGGKDHCGWCLASGGDRDRVLTVEVSAGDPPSTASGTSAAGDALRALEPASNAEVTAGKAARTVSGLGDEATYRYSPALTALGNEPRGASLRFRGGAVVVSVGYDGRDFSDDGPQHQVPEAEARRAVLAAASDVAHALGAPAKPVFAEPAPGGPPPVRHVPHPCDLVPAALAERLAPGAERRRDMSPRAVDPMFAPYGSASDTCVWDSTPTCCLNEDTDHRPERHLSVTVWSVSEWRRGIAVRQAARTYLEWHHDAREGAGRTGFRAVRGLGDQAYAVHLGGQAMGDDRRGGEMAFRYRNLLVQVDYTGARNETLPASTAINAAYTVAAAARAVLPA